MLKKLGTIIWRKILRNHFHDIKCTDTVVVCGFLKWYIINTLNTITNQFVLLLLL